MENPVVEIQGDEMTRYVLFLEMYCTCIIQVLMLNAFFSIQEFIREINVLSSSSVLPRNRIVFTPCFVKELTIFFSSVIMTT